MGESLSATELRSLRMDRRSPEAARLRDAVSKKLLDFLGNYSDDVLAEYIVVLVCNGKHQTQARDDLQAFLGEESGTFVDWLWNYLSKNFTAEATPDALDPEAKKVTKSSNSLDSEHKINVLTDHVSHSIGLSKTKNETFDRPSYRANSNHMEPIKVSVRQKSCPPDLDDCSADINNEILMVDDISLHKSSGSRSGNFIEPAKNSISIKSSQEVASVGKQALHCESQNRKIQKIRSSAVPSQLLPEPMAEQTAIVLPSVIAEKQLSPSSSTNPVETKMLSTDVDDSLHQMARLRGNVWDRLGRPHAHTQKSIKEAQSHNLDFIDGGMLDNQEEPQNPILKRFPPVASSVSCLNKQAYAVDRGGLEGISAKISVEGRLDQANNINTLKRKIDADGYFRVKEPSQQQQQSLPIKQNRQQNMNMSAKVADKPVSSLIDKPVSSNAKFGLINPAYTGPESIGTVLSQSCVKKDSMTSPVMNLVPVSKSLLAKSKSQSRKDAGNASQKPMQDDMFAVKSKIQQIEMDMLKLRSKQVRQSTDGKQNVSSVFQNHFDEGIESRTVLVANVHFAATKESLISHFGKCGTISKVIMLTDAVTGLPKGAAYLVFANKESVDKAISLSGTSFFSRILKVIRKVEVPPDYLVPSHPASKQQLQQPFYPYPYGQVPTPKSHKSSHLQWRRDQHLSSENPLTTSSNRLGSSRPIE